MRWSNDCHDGGREFESRRPANPFKLVTYIDLLLIRPTTSKAGGFMSKPATPANTLRKSRVLDDRATAGRGEDAPSLAGAEDSRQDWQSLLFREAASTDEGGDIQVANSVAAQRWQDPIECRKRIASDC
jgi:hypothetical protein